ncbi:MAG: YciI family protein [Gammaproteobacteria bacterium]|nr:YciI family protein [Gammaproteobacteria bacterium]MDP2139620.1 YciI family protein [Gammaproteobacteria bacterium]MDP2346593.1 YciI family protein [Gammaproteobacteria bacterium]
MKYLLLIYCEEKIWDTVDRLPFRDASVALCHELAEEGKYIAASPLKNVDTAVSLRIRDGKTLITDGPFAETREQLGGYFLIDVANLEEAKAVAARIPSAVVATVEIRPLEVLEGMP